MVSNKHQTFLGLREKFPVFTYKAADIQWHGQQARVCFHFQAGDEWHFSPVWHMDFGRHRIRNIDKQLDKWWVHQLGMVEMISYWKAMCPPRIHILPFRLTENQQKWWKKLFRFGLGEMFYTNDIPDPAGDIFSFSFGDEAVVGSAPRPGGMHNLPEQYLMPVGGGKDSVVGMDILLRSDKTVIPFVVNPREATDRVLAVAGFTEQFSSVTITRKIDPLLLKLNTLGYLNGHTPFSAVLAFASAFVADKLGVRHIALSNESSASEPTIPGTKINHQYSKSYEFELDFRQYIRDQRDDHLNYFSLLRPMNELQIAGLFAGLPSYHAAFRSCNAGSKTDSWCGNCPKCLFTYIVLAVFMSPGELVAIFGKELFNDGNLWPIVRSLAGLDPVKPFECVGTLAEVNAALSHIVSGYHDRGQALPPLLKLFADHRAKEAYDGPDIRTFLSATDSSHAVPSNLVPVLMDRLAMLRGAFNSH